jgi:hydrogenase maturation factor HypF (carbamoyltransferase family)
MNGHYCDNCESHLNDEDYHGYGSWSYTCPDCGFRYSHSIELPVSEQVKQFKAAQQPPAQG